MNPDAADESNLYHVMHDVHGAQPQMSYLNIVVVALAVIGTTGLLWFRMLSKEGGIVWFRSLGVRLEKIARSIREIERKTFHLCGLGVPLAYYTCTNQLGWTQDQFKTFCWCFTALVWLGDSARVLCPGVMNYPPYSLLRGVIRDKEKGQLSGTCYFSAGCSLSIMLYPPAVAITSIVWLVVGDMTAALIGVAFGGETCVIKMGREGNKSLEGSVAMFVACVLCGLLGWVGVPLADYAVIVGSLAATVVELHEPFGLNDNITIPVISGAALQFALSRVERCT